MSSGLYDALTERALLLYHQEQDLSDAPSPQAYKIIKPERIEFLSYPYEWCFSQYKEAALATLEIQKASVERGMTLKDASAYNIQFHNGRPILIDTLSFEVYSEGQIWRAYRQFCQHFLAPLALMAYSDIRLSRLMRIYIDGIPLDLTSSLLPHRTGLRPSILTHIHLHSRSRLRQSDKPVAARRGMSGRAFLGLVESLESAINSLAYRPANSEWSDYYDDNNYTDESFGRKEAAVVDFLETIKPASVWDLGSNTGHFSRLASSKGILTISMDGDPAAVERNYIECKRGSDTACLPLWIDLANPSPGIGWRNEERVSLLERGTPDCVMALALIHHLAISNNVPLRMLAEYFASMCRHLIVEFVPKNDSQVIRLLRTREDIFDDYTEQGFEDAFARFFSTVKKVPLSNSKRTVYLMAAKEM
jgi:hypothetical protein